MNDDPICDSTGICEAAVFMDDYDIGICIHCGAEMFKENGSWFHHSQQETLFDNRGVTHYGPV